MSGTSLDGLDLAFCTFEYDDDKKDRGLTECNNDSVCNKINNYTSLNLEQNIKYRIEKATTIPYDKELKDKITACENCSGEYLAEFSAYLGHFFGKEAKKFLTENNLAVDFIASHGQTVFHQPDKLFTLQIGDINSIAAESECTVIGDFRSLDVALGGQGAPLVPFGDKILFKQYPYCLNIGGFSNISFDEGKKRTAYDICPANIVLNHLCRFINLPYDDGGKIAEHSEINEDLLRDLNDIPYYVNKERQSLGKEWVEKFVFPILNSYSISYQSKIATYTEHIATEIAEHINGDCLVTGGGAYNTFLINRIGKQTNYKIIIPDNLTIQYKEALIFAFLGLRRLRNEINCLRSVTGAKKDSCSGAVVYYK